jgi:hypothetical protein
MNNAVLAPAAQPQTPYPLNSAKVLPACDDTIMIHVQNITQFLYNGIILMKS